MRIPLKCVEPGRSRDHWAIELTDGCASIIGPAGSVLIRLTPEQAGGAVLLPEACDGCQLGIRDGSRVVLFKVSRNGRRQLEAFFNNAIIQQGPEAIAAVRTDALHGLLAGLLFVAVGAGATVAGFLSAASKPHGGSYLIFHGVFALGLGAVIRSCCAFARHARLRRMSEPQRLAQGPCPTGTVP